MIILSFWIPSRQVTYLRAVVIFASAFALGACSQLRDYESPRASQTFIQDPDTPTASSQTDELLATQDRWLELLEMYPYPFTGELPPLSVTILDGTYVRLDPRPGERAGCRRCPPYPPEGGIWRLELEQGVFRVMHERTAWRSLGSFTVDGQLITFFNDPQCIDTFGKYTWEMEAGRLRFQVDEDFCGKDLRARNFASQPWESCQPPVAEAVVSDHWAEPFGCDLEERVEQSK